MTIDMNALLWCVVGIIGSTVFAYIISWFFSGRYSLVADIITVLSERSRYSKELKITEEVGMTAYDSYVILKNNGNQSLTMKDFAPLNMPRVIISDGKLQNRKKPYYVLSNPDPYAAYNNVHLSDSGNGTIYISFDQLKVGQRIEIIIHSYVSEARQNKDKLYVSATLINGKFIPRRKLNGIREIYGFFALIILWIVLIAAGINVTLLSLGVLLVPQIIKLVSMVTESIYRRKIE